MIQRSNGKPTAVKGEHLTRTMRRSHTKDGSGMSFESNPVGPQCASKFTTPCTAIMAYTDDGVSHWDETVTYPDGTSSKTYRSTLDIYSGTALTVPYKVYWARSDLSVFPPSYASSLATRIGVPFTITSPPTALPKISPRPNVPLTSGQKAGIGVGSSLGALVLISSMIALLFWRRKRRAQRLRDHHPTEPELSGHSRGLKIFLRGVWRTEAEAVSQPVEAGGRSVMIISGSCVELEA